MKIEVHSLLCNEARLIPYFMRHYKQFADVYFYESNSHDGSRKIAQRLGAKVIDFPTGNEIDENMFLDMKNNCWKDSKADWVIVGDTDEFVYHPQLVKGLEHTNYTIFHPKEWRMYSKTFPTTGKQIYEEVVYGRPGAPNMNKMNLFRPSEIKEMNYGVGCHTAKPEGNVQLCPDTKIITLHMHHLSKEYRIEKNKQLAERLSDINKKNGWGFHVLLPESIVNSRFDREMEKLVRVL